MISTAIHPPPPVHELRAPPFPRLFRMTGSPGNRGFGRYLRQRIKTLVAREKTPVEKAITMAYLGSFLVDHIVHAEKTACRILEHRDMSEPEETSLWDHHYGSVIPTLIEEQPDAENIHQALQQLEAYSRLPQSIFRSRQRHWNAIRRLLESGHTPESPSETELTALAKVQFVLASERSPRAKARIVCLAASLVADRICWCRHIPWPAAYLQTMTDIYPFLVTQPDVLQEIIYLP